MRNEPLMFIQGPPIFIKVIVKQEESTSVFVLNGEQQEKSGETEPVIGQHEETELIKGIDPSVIRRIMYLGSPFSRQVYHPLQFVLGEEILTGTIEKIDGETVVIGVGEGEKEMVSVDLRRIEEILWRGDPFVEN